MGLIWVRFPLRTAFSIAPDRIFGFVSSTFFSAAAVVGAPSRLHWLVRSPVRSAKAGATGVFVSGPCAVSGFAAGCPVMGAPLRYNVRRGSWARLFGRARERRAGCWSPGRGGGCLVGMGDTGAANGDAASHGSPTSRIPVSPPKKQHK